MKIQGKKYGKRGRIASKTHIFFTQKLKAPATSVSAPVIVRKNKLIWGLVGVDRNTKYIPLTGEIRSAPRQIANSVPCGQVFNF